MRQGPLIAIAGIDGAGKSTQVELLTEHLRKNHLNAVSTHTEMAALFSIFSLSEKLYGDRGAYHPMIPATLREFTIACDVVHFSETRLTKLLADGGPVIWDRSPLCYEAYARVYGADMYWILQLLQLVEQPNLIILLDLEAEQAAARLLTRTSKPRQAHETHDFLGQVRGEYRRLAEKRTDVVLINAARSVEEVHREICGTVGGRLHLS
jgi:dTMP kinase